MINGAQVELMPLEDTFDEGAPKAELRLRVTNITRGTVLADRAEIANDSAKRRKGLLKHMGLMPGEGLWIVPSEGVHSFGMKFTIDVVYLNKKRQVLKLYPHMGKGKVSLCLRAHSVVELPAGTIEETGTQKGDHLELVKFPIEELEAHPGRVQGSDAESSPILERPETDPAAVPQTAEAEMAEPETAEPETADTPAEELVRSSASLARLAELPADQDSQSIASRDEAADEAESAASRRFLVGPRVGDQMRLRFDRSVPLPGPLAGKTDGEKRPEKIHSR